MESRRENHRHKRLIRHRRVRHKTRGTSLLPRLAVFRSNKHIYAQIIDDGTRRTLIAHSDLKLKTDKLKENKKIGKLEKAYEIGLSLAKSAHKKKIKKVVFDRGGYKYHGRVKSLAEGARKGGLIL